VDEVNGPRRHGYPGRRTEDPHGRTRAGRIYLLGGVSGDVAGVTAIGGCLFAQPLARSN
jgi:hypothetical protein